MTKKTKVQITLPEELVQEIENECNRDYLTKSAWFLKVVKAALEKKEKRRVIQLDI